MSLGPQSIQLGIEDRVLNEALTSILIRVRSAGGRALLVGGCVRDALLGMNAKDLDIEVYGLSPDQLTAAMADAFRIDLVGASFGVIKIHGLPIDVSIPRRESKTGLGHKGFKILSDSSLTPEEAALRRDFTINAMALDPEAGTLVDPYHGSRDLEAKILRHTSSKFAEDPLRVLRGMQFAARFDFTVAPETIEACSRIVPEGLAAERIFEEWSKLILRGVRLSRGLQFLRDCGWIQYFPELQALIDCPQDPEWHPEGDVWTHTLHCMDAFAAERTGDAEEDLTVGFAVLCHDLGKPATTEFVDGRIRSRSHEEVGDRPTRAFLGRMTANLSLVESVVPLVVDHLKPKELFDANAGEGAIRRLASRVGRIDRLVRVARADQQGRPPLVFDGFPAGEWLLEKARAERIDRSAPKPIVMGRHLIELGLKPGVHFGPLLQACYEAQLEARISTLEEGIALAKELVSSRAEKTSA
jgi:tRNA nucleotidyltransferase (CCA-adding enzyme)